MDSRDSVQKIRIIKFAIEYLEYMNHQIKLITKNDLYQTNDYSCWAKSLIHLCNIDKICETHQERKGCSIKFEPQKKIQFDRASPVVET